MTPLDSFLPLLRGRLPGCPDIVLKDATRDAAIEFCRRTELLVQTAPLTVIAGERVAWPDFDAGTAWEVLSLTRDGRMLSPVNRRETLTQSWDVDTGVPLYYYLEGDGSLILAPIPDANETLALTVTVCPTATATEVDDALYHSHREAIAAGARAWVRRNLGDWVNPQLEAEDRKVFEYAIHNQNIRRARGGANTPLRVRATPF